MKTQRDRDNAARDYAAAVLAEPETLPPVKPFPIERARLNSASDSRPNTIVGEVNTAIQHKSRKHERLAYHWFDGDDTSPAVIDNVCAAFEAAGYGVECDEPTPTGSILMKITW